jgi:hypothetical protein
MTDKEKINELEIKIESLGKGPLTLVVGCNNCGSYFGLNNESVALAVITHITFLDYLRWIQSSVCPSCKQKNE